MRDASRCQGYGHPVAGVDDLEGPFVPAHLRLARAGDADAQKYLAGVPLGEVATLENIRRGGEYLAVALRIDCVYRPAARVGAVRYLIPHPIDRRGASHAAGMPDFREVGAGSSYARDLTRGLNDEIARVGIDELGVDPVNRALDQRGQEQQIDVDQEDHENRHRGYAVVAASDRPGRQEEPCPQRFPHVGDYPSSLISPSLR